MKEIFIKNKIIIFRTVGAIMFLVGLIMLFWTDPKEIVLSENEIAAANIARMEAKVRSGSSASKQVPKPDGSTFVEELENNQKKQEEQLIILSMLFGALLLIYSFIPKAKSDSEK
ncbi:MAG: hypothetical protein Q7U00_06150 [Sulfurimonas sp.]|nr:hypothetical protein [Sulfurimonas sp.]